MPFDDRFNAAFGGQMYDPAMGLALIQNPEAIIPHLVARGATPPADIPKGVDHTDAGQSLGRALSFAGRDSSGDPMPFPTPSRIPGNYGGQPVDAPTPPVAARPVVMPQIVRTTKTDRLATPSQQGAPEVPVPKPQVPTPAPEAAMATGAAAPSATSTNQDVEPTPKADAARTSKHSGLDDLGQALAGVRAIAPPQPQHIFSPQAPRPTNQIARSNAPQVLMQELMAATRPGALLRLGQALGGK